MGHPAILTRFFGRPARTDNARRAARSPTTIGRRAFIAGLGAALGSATFALAAQPAAISNGESGSSVRGKLNQIISSTNQLVVNVQDYGALGNGSHDDTANIQAAFDAAFGTAGNQTNFVSKSVYLPPGNYIVTSPLYLTGILGGRIFGAGQGASQIFYSADGTQGNTLSGADPTLTPIIAMDGWGYGIIENLSIGAPSANGSVTTMLGIYVYQSGNHGYTGASQFNNSTIYNCYDGILGGSGPGNCDNCILNNVQFNTCGLAGLRLVSANAINWQVYGGGASRCAYASTYNPDTPAGGNSGAAYCALTGSIGTISGVSCSYNKWDIINAGAQQMTVIGGSFEGPPITNISTATWSGGTATITTASAHGYTGTIPIAVSAVSRSGYNGQFTGTVTGTTTITYTVADPGGSGSSGQVSTTDTGSIAANGSVISVNGCTYRPGNSNGCRMFDCVFSGTIVASGQTFNPGNSTGAGKVASLGNNGILIMDGGIFGGAGAASIITGANSAKVYLRGALYGATYTNLLTSFTGTVAQNI